MSNGAALHQGNPASPQSASGRFFPLPSQVAVTSFVATCLIAGWAWFLSNSHFAAFAKADHSQVISTDRSHPPDNRYASPSKSAQSGQHEDLLLQQRRAVAKSQLISYQFRLKRIRRLQDELRPLVFQLDQDLQRLMHGDQGRRIAANQTALRRFAYLTELPRPTLHELEKYGRQLATIDNGLPSSPPLDSAFSLTPELDRELHALENHAAGSLHETQELRSLLIAILAAVKDTPPATVDLADAIDAWNAQDSHEVERRVEERLRPIEAEMASKLQEASEAKHRAEADVSEAEQMLVSEQQRSFDAVNTRRQAIDAHEDQMAQRRRTTREEFQNALPDIRKHLTPFTSPGYVQPKSEFDFEQTTNKAPMSYAALLRIGALEPSDDGLAILLRFGGSKRPGFTNDRPLGSFPQYDSEFVIQKPTVIAKLKTVQQLLRDHGEFMVEAGLLSP